MCMKPQGLCVGGKGTPPPENAVRWWHVRVATWFCGSHSKSVEPGRPLKRPLGVGIFGGIRENVIFYRIDNAVVT